MTIPTSRLNRGALFMGCALLLLGAMLCGLDIVLGALFFPIGPDGLSPRDAALRALTPWLWGGGALLALAGVGLLLAAWLGRLLRRRS